MTTEKSDRPALGEIKRKEEIQYIIEDGIIQRKNECIHSCRRVDAVIGCSLGGICSCPRNPTVCLCFEGVE